MRNSITLFAMAGLGAMLSACAATPVPEPVASLPPAAAILPERVPALPEAIAFASIEELQAGMAQGRFTAVQLVGFYQARIESIDRSGPNLRAVLALNPDALRDAEALDLERKAKGPRGPLHGIPILIKDNIETQDRMATTAGSLALKDNLTGRDAPLVARLRAAGAIILGKTNLSEWANIRDGDSTSGWSAMGGLTRNPHALDRSACGSSSGSGAAVAAGLAAAAIGTETDGSVVCPASMNGIVGLKPTVGLVSRRHIVPISSSQDTAGPMARSVRDVAVLLSVIAGSDSQDPATAQADARRADYADGLGQASLAGKRFGYFKNYGAPPQVGLDAMWARSIEALRRAGASVIVIEEEPPNDKIGEAEFLVLLTELKAGMAAYLQSLPANGVTVRSLADLIAFNSAHADQELALFGQSVFIQAEASKGLSDPAYLKALANSRRLAGKDGLERLLKLHKLDAIIAPTTGPAWQIDVINGDSYTGGNSTLAAVSGYPHLTLPMGIAQGLPAGLSFMGPAWSEGRLLALGAAFEGLVGPAPHPKFAANVDGEAAIAPLLIPAK